MNYAVSQGLTKNLTFNFPIQPVYFPVLGFVAISVSSWSFILQKILDLKASPKKVLIKSLKLMLFLLVIAATALYLPYILSSNWFGSILTILAIKAPQLTNFIDRVSATLIYFWSLNEEWKYVFSQFLGASSLTLASLIEGVLLGREIKRKIKERKEKRR